MRVAGDAICSDHDVALPRLYLLGQQKSGSTTMATAFYQAGVVPMVGYWPHGNVPGYLQSMRDNHSSIHLSGNIKESNLLAGTSTCHGASPVCMADAQLRWERKLVNFTQCAQRWRTTLLADMSTDYFPRAEYALALSRFYHTSVAQRLIFVVIMREPLQRFQSGFYWKFSPQHFGLPPSRKHAHNHTLRAELALLRAALPPNYTSVVPLWPRLARSKMLDRWVRSMYALNWGPWLEQFHASQFVALPMRWALEDVGRATQLVAQRFGVALHRQAHILGNGSRRVGIAGEGDWLNPRAHPTIEEDSDADAQTRAGLQWLATTHFAPDTRALARTLARAMRHGLVLGGAQGSRENDVLRCLNENW